MPYWLGNVLLAGVLALALCVVSFFFGVGWHEIRRMKVSEMERELADYRRYFEKCEPVDSEVCTDDKED